MPVYQITATSDARLEPYQNVRDADLRGSRRLFMCEGRLVVESLLASPNFETHSLLVSEKQIDSMEDVLANHPGLTVLVVDQETMNDIVGFDIHRGVLGAGVRTEPEHLERLITTRRRDRQRSRVFVLEELANHDNVGGIFRNALAFGVDCVSLDPRCCDPLYRKSIRVSMGAVLHVPFTQAHSTAESITILKEMDYHVAALTPSDDAQSLTEFATTAQAIDRLALCFGAEGDGLTSTALERADSRVRIEMEPTIDSLNVMVSSAIAAHATRACGR
ncbi:MAG: TrmH family RNA methyltransferase [Phycisphaerales bacterium JB043]